MSDISNIIVNIEDYKDNWDVVVQKNKDGGDALQRNSHYWLLRKLALDDQPFSLNLYNKTMNTFEVGYGIYIRHPDKSKWYSNPKNCSRDQVSIAILSMVVMNDVVRLKRVAMDLLKRCGFHRNTQDGITGKPVMPDIVSPSELTSILRGLNTWILYPLIAFLDIGMLLDVLYFRKNNLYDYDNMLASQILVANSKYPTSLSKLSRYFYKRTDYKQRITDYYSESAGKNGIEPLGELYNVVNTKLIG